MNRSAFLTLLLFAATLLTIWAFGLVLAPFLVPIAWAMCLVTVTGGLYRRLARRIGRPRLAAFLMTVATAVFVLAPLVAVGFVVVRQAVTVAEKVDSKTTVTVEAEAPAPTGDPWDDFFTGHPSLAGWRDRVDDVLKPFQTTTKEVAFAARDRLGLSFARGTAGVLQGIFAAGFGFVMMLATLYFLYRDGRRIHDFVVDVVPVPVEDTERILETLRSTTFAAVVGGLATAIIQGALGGIALSVVGIDAPVLWGFVMAVLSLIPVGGSAFVWAPVSVYFFLDGPVWKGWFLLAWGVAVIGSSDNLLRPVLMRRAGAATVHPLLLFFAILSGIGLFGVSGIVFGPLLVAFVQAVAKVYQEAFGRRARAGATDAAAPPGA